MPKNIVKRAADYCATPKFERVFDDFAREHADAFLDAIEAKGGDVEHKHEYKELYDNYLQLFESELSDFVESEGSTIEEFFNECREIFEGQYTALFEEHQYAWFVEHLLACMDYKQFYGLMVNEARRQIRGAGQLGLGNRDDFAVPQGLDHFKETITLTTGGCHSIGWSAQGELYIWGDNEKQQLARPRDVACLVQPTRSLVTQEDRVETAACGWSHTIVVTSQRAITEQTVLSWGAHDNYQLGRRLSTDQPSCTPYPINLPGLTRGHRVVSVSCGWKHSLLVLNDGSVFSWGSGRHGELGLGDSDRIAPEPTLVSTLGDCSIDSVYCGWQHSVFSSSRSGNVYTCGHNRHGQLGVPTASESVRSVPVKVLDAFGNPLRAAQIAVGWHFAVCLSVESTLVSWGKGSHGQLGLGSLETVEVPTVINFDEPVTSIACGSEHTMVVTGQGDLFTCGWGEHGNLGHGDTENWSSLTKVQFFREHDWRVVAVTAGGAVSIAHALRRSTNRILVDHKLTS